MSTDSVDVERLLRRAFAPVDPPERLSARVESTLQTLTDAAVDELESWELHAMKDPRNWVRPVVASAVGASAGTALIVLRVRAAHKRRHRSRNPAVQMRKTADAAAAEARRLLRR